MVKRQQEQKSDRIVGLTLADVSINFQQQDEEKDVEAEFDYGVTVTRPKFAQDVFAFSCSLSVRKKYKEGDGDAAASISADYFCAVAGSVSTDEKNIALAKKYAQTSIWSEFRSLFAVCSQQMGIMFPILPPAPHSVDLSEPDEDEERP